MIQVACIAIPAKIPETVYRQLLQFLPQEKQRLILSLHHRFQAYQKLIGDLLVRYQAAATLDLTNEKLLFERGSLGKPFLTNEREFQYNLSYSEQWVTGAFDSIPLGLDVEAIKPINMNSYTDLFSPQELKSLQKKRGVDRLQHFFALWSLKESYIKATGLDVAQGLEHFSVLKIGRRYILDDSTSEQCANFKLWELDKTHRLALCSLQEEANVQLKVWSFDKFLTLLKNLK